MSHAVLTHLPGQVLERLLLELFVRIDLRLHAIGICLVSLGFVEGLRVRVEFRVLLNLLMLHHLISSIESHARLHGLLGIFLQRYALRWVFVIVFLRLIELLYDVSGVEIGAPRSEDVWVPQVCSALPMPTSKLLVLLALIIVDELSLSAHHPSLVHPLPVDRLLLRTHVPLRNQVLVPNRLRTGLFDLAVQVLESTLRYLALIFGDEASLPFTLHGFETLQIVSHVVLDYCLD